MSRFVISGAPGAAANRLEINDFIKNDKFFSLYVQALQIMSSVPQNEVRSFFQIGGIHGLPYVPWDGITGDQPITSDDIPWGGYCTHASVLFPTWHRPYVLAYEQILQKHAQDIAATYTTSDRHAWIQAAANLRQPYWDWAVNAVPPDQVIAMKQVQITKHNGQKIHVDNPLYHYKFHPIHSSFPNPFSDWQTTLRQPTGNGHDATDNVVKLRNILRTAQANITTNTYSMLTRIHTWPAFSNITVGDGGSTSNSLEAIHNGIHNDIGGGGHMSDAGLAGFDPIFYLHHCNVDRMLSLWAALNPGVWVTPGDSGSGTIVIPPGAPIDSTTALTPFSNTQTTFWTSSETTDTTKLGYTYPEFNGLDLGNTQAVQRAIGNRVNRLYGSAIFGSLANTVPAATTSPVGIDSAALLAPVQHPIPLPAGDIPAGGAEPIRGFHDWTARVEFKQREYGTSFSVLLFLGPVAEDPQEWLVSPSFVGAHHAFVNSAAEKCANCRNQGDMVVEGFVHLTHFISQHAGLPSLNPDVVEPYLTKELHWKVLKTDGSVGQLESLEVSVYGTPMSLPTGSMFPVPGSRRCFHGITHGRSGGSRHALV